MQNDDAQFLAIDTSCYTTSIAVVSRGCVICDKRLMLAVSKGSRGLRQSNAVFQHVKQLKMLFDECDEMPGRVCAVCCSAKPCPSDSSYMPVFCVGESYAAACSAMLGAKSYALTHQHGHIYSAFFGNTVERGEYCVFHVSGGTLDIMCVEIDETVGEITSIGGGLDITCGQLIDRVGVAAGLAFPSGKLIEQMYMRGGTKLAVNVSGLSANLSGAETQAMRMLEDGAGAVYVCSGVIDCVAQTLSELIANTIKATRLKKFIFTGGVICNNIIREKIKQTCEMNACVCVLAQKQYCSDNACGLAMAAELIYKKEKTIEHH